MTFGLLWFIDVIKINPKIMKVFAFYTAETKNITFIKDDIIDEVICILILIGGLLAAFSKEKNEDEYISKIRLESLLTATYINYGLLFYSIIFVYDTGFFNILVFNMFTLLVIFLIGFNFLLYKAKQGINAEK